MKKISNFTIETAVANRSRAMESGDHFKNEQSSKSQIHRRNWKLITLFILITCTFVLSSCKKGKDDDNAELPEYIAIDRQYLGGQIDFAILGLDGSGYFYEFQDENQNIPQRLSIYDGNKGKVDLVINFDENGLPKNILSDDFTIVLGNYAGNRFDAVFITKEGKSQLFENIETDTSWEEYMNDISETVSRVNPQIKASVSSNPLEWVNTVVSVVGCGLSLSNPATAATLAAISCTSAIYNVFNVFGWMEMPQFLADAAFLGNYAGLLQCVPTNLLNVFVCITDLAGAILFEVGKKENSAIEAIRKGEIIILQAGNGNVTHTGGQGVYVAGWERNAQNIDVAILWKNGVAQNLTDGTYDARAHSVYISNNDVYVAGYERNVQGYNYVAKLWKNGVAQNLTDGTNSAQASSVYVSGNDVYVAGSKLWKNGVIQKLPDGTDHPGGNSVYISGSDVYVAGSECSGFGTCGPRLWENGVAQNLYAGYALSVYASGRDVYVTGYVEYTLMEAFSARLWKNGVQQFRPMLAVYFDNENSFARALSVFVSGGDVYVAGYQGRYIHYAVLWKNGLQLNLTDGSSYAYARSVYVSGSDVYVAGKIGNFAVLWINGLALGLTDGTRWADANSVFVIE